MDIKLYRYSSQSKTTLGIIHVDKKFQCYSIEDRYRKEKVKGETRIQAGRYEIKLREFGGHYEKYVNKYEGHEGMLWLQDVPNFEDILIHIGNDAKDTAGCLLVGSTANNNAKNKGFISGSTEAYLDLYFKVLPELKAGRKVFIGIIDLDIAFS